VVTAVRERAPSTAGAAVAARSRSAAPATATRAQRVLAVQGSAGNGAVARVAAGGDVAAMSAAGLTGAAPVVAMPTAAPVPVGPIPEMVPGTSAAEAREAQPERRSWWDRVKSAVSDAIASIGAGLGSLSSRVLGAVAGRARQIPGYGLLSLALGRDVVTRQEVPRTPVNLIGALAGLIPGGQAMFENIQRTGVIERAAAWFSAQVPKLGLTWESIQGLFRRAWDALGVRDLLDPAGAWAKIAGIFGPPLQALKTFALAAGTKLLEFVFEGGLSLAGPLGSQVMALVRRAGNVLTTIVRDPIGFAGNLVRAVRGGLGAFMRNIGGHLRTGLFAWLTGALRGAGTLPAQFDLRGILSLVTQILGLTWSWLRGRLVRLLGEERVALLERAVDWVQRIATQGLSAIWEKMAEFATGLVDTVIGGIRDWVARSVVGAAITRLITMFNPAGAIIQAIIAAYNTVKFFIERAQQLAALANSVFDSIGAIAGGAIGAAVTRVERSLARALPVALGFLARLIGLGDIAAPVRNLIARARGVLDRAMDRVVEWLAGMGRRLSGPARGSTGTHGTSSDGEVKTRRLRAAMAAAVRAGDRWRGRPVAARLLLPHLALIRVRYGLRALELAPSPSGRWQVTGTLNPTQVEQLPVLLFDQSRAGEAALTFTRLANRVEQRYFGNPSPEVVCLLGQAIRHPVAQEIYGEHRRGDITGINNATLIAGQRQVLSDIRASGQPLPSGALVDLQRQDTRIRALMNPTAAQPANQHVSNVADYGDFNLPSAKLSGTSFMRFLDELRRAGMEATQISRLLQHASSTGTAVTPAMLRDYGFVGTPRPALAAAINRINHVTNFLEPLRFLERGDPSAPEGSSARKHSQPIASTTGLSQEMLQGGRLFLSQVYGSDATHAPAAQRPLVIPAPGMTGTIATSSVRITILIERVRADWSDWKLRTSERLNRAVRAAGMVRAELVPSEERIEAVLRGMFGRVHP
jgi:hypothetical protein